jgi:hypothetical protein
MIKEIIKKYIFDFSQPITKKIFKFKNIHKGGSCYIFGDGISLKWFDLRAFSKKPTFALSKIIFHKQSHYLNIKYLLAIEPYWFYPYNYSYFNKWWRNKIQKKTRKYIKEKKYSLFLNLSNFPIIRSSNLFFLFKYINDPQFAFKKDCIANNEDMFGGSFRCSIALAIYMGFKDIILVGCDYTHKNSRSRHWYEKGKGNFLPQNQYCSKYLKIAQKYAKISTLTIEREFSGVLPEISYKNYTGKQPFFRENDDLINLENREMLSSIDEYKIF